jgi:hypothetical protein
LTVALARGGVALGRGAVACLLEGAALAADRRLDVTGGVLAADTVPPAAKDGSTPAERGGAEVTGAFDAEQCVRKKNAGAKKNVRIRSAD